MFVTLSHTRAESWRKEGSERGPGEGCIGPDTKPARFSAPGQDRKRCCLLHAENTYRLYNAITSHAGKKEPPHPTALSSLRHKRPHPPPKVAPRPPAPLPRIRIHQLKRIPQPRSSKLGDIRRIGRKRRGLKRQPAALVEVDLVGPRQGPDGPVGRRVGGECGVWTVGEGGGYGGVGAGDEVAPDGHEGSVESGALVRGGEAGDGGDVGAVLGADDGVLVFIGSAVVGCEGGGEPV